MRSSRREGLVIIPQGLFGSVGLEQLVCFFVGGCFDSLSVAVAAGVYYYLCLWLLLFLLLLVFFLPGKQAAVKQPRTRVCT